MLILIVLLWVACGIIPLFFSLHMDELPIRSLHCVEGWWCMTIGLIMVIVSAIAGPLVWFMWRNMSRASNKVYTARRAV